MTPSRHVDPFSIKDYIDMRFTEIESARHVAYLTMEKRLEGMNEFRNQLKDQSSCFMTRNEYESKHEILASKIHDLELSKAELKGKASQSALNISLAISAAGILLSTIALVKEFLK
jgi:CO dehydrogenase nickel-insertion accessory protein CooC1